MCAQDGIQPMWEDVKNKSGGRWLFNLEKRDRRDLLDHCWLETVRDMEYGDRLGISDMDVYTCVQH